MFLLKLWFDHIVVQMHKILENWLIQEINSDHILFSKLVNTIETKTKNHIILYMVLKYWFIAPLASEIWTTKSVNAKNES